MLSSFCDNLRDIRDYHRRYPPASIFEESDKYEQMINEEPYVEFSSEEAYDQSLDLNLIPSCVFAGIEDSS